MGDLILTREKQEMYSFAEYKVFIDGKLVSTIANGTTKVLSLQPGSHEVFVKVIGAKSKVKQVNIKHKGTVRLTCGTTLTGMKYLLAVIFIFSRNKIILEETV